MIILGPLLLELLEGRRSSEFPNKEHLQHLAGRSRCGMMSFARALYKLRTPDQRRLHDLRGLHILCSSGRVVGRFCSPCPAATRGDSHAATNFFLLQPERHFSSGTDVPPVTRHQRGFFPRRAVMYVPASDERKTKKAASLSVDTLVFDLEDGVATNQKVLLGKPLQFAAVQLLTKINDG